MGSPRFWRLTISQLVSQQKRVYPYPLGARPARPNPKMGAPDPAKPLFLELFVLRGGLRPWSQTMVLEGARPWGGGRSGDCEHYRFDSSAISRDTGQRRPIWCSLPGIPLYLYTPTSLLSLPCGPASGNLGLRCLNVLEVGSSSIFLQPSPCAMSLCEAQGQHSLTTLYTP